MSQDVEIQLQVWKDLAISKQILMGAATDALGLDAECTTEELKAALDSAIQRARDADINIQETRAQADAQVAEFRERAETAEAARAEAESRIDEALRAREQAERQLANGKAENAEAIKRARAEVAEKQNRLKAISKALADTPENVVRKLKNLKKQKMDEAKLRTQTENKLQKSRKENAQLEAEIETQKQQLADASELLEQFQALHDACQQARSRLEALSDKPEDRIEIPAVDLERLENLREALAAE